NARDRLLQLNPGLDPTRLRVGQQIRVPAGNAPQWFEGMQRPDTTVSPFEVATTEPDLFRSDEPAATWQRPQPPARESSASTARALTELTTRYLDLQGEVETASIAAEESEQLAKNGTG